MIRPSDFAQRPRVLVVLGTRPEAIKVFPIIHQLRSEPRLDTRVVVTGQHREMVDDLLRPLGIVPDDDLMLTRTGSSLNELVGRMIPLLDALYDRLHPAMVVVQGDTTTAFCAALAAFHRRIQVAHVEAGLRSHDHRLPFPEEVNRRMITAVTDLHLAPTQASARNLEMEGIPADSIVVTGNTAVDSVLHVLRGNGVGDAIARSPAGARARPHVLVTMHRRESWIDADANGRTTLDAILGAIRNVAQRRPDVDFSYPVHPNPRVKESAERTLSDLRNVRLLAPQPYLEFVHLMASSSVILTDSGGIQEEAPSLGIPVLVARDVTERPEGVAAGCNRLVGTDADAIERELLIALANLRANGGALPRPNPYGDGQAGARIKQAILHRLVQAEPPAPFAPALALAASSN